MTAATGPTVNPLQLAVMKSLAATPPPPAFHHTCLFQDLLRWNASNWRQQTRLHADLIRFRGQREEERKKKTRKVRREIGLEVVPKHACAPGSTNERQDV